MLFIQSNDVKDVAICFINELMLSYTNNFMVVFRWVNPFMGIGAKKDLEVSDLYDVVPGDNSEVLGLKLQE